jgi:hypothetical protein
MGRPAIPFDNIGPLSAWSFFVSISFACAVKACMMFYHDGLRILDAEKARHSSKTRATLLIYISHPLVTLKVMLTPFVSRCHISHIGTELLGEASTLNLVIRRVW